MTCLTIFSLLCVGFFGVCTEHDGDKLRKTLLKTFILHLIKSLNYEDFLGLIIGCYSYPHILYPSQHSLLVKVKIQGDKEGDEQRN